MSATRDRFPRRDEHGRVVGLPDLLALTTAALLTTAAVLLLVDAVGVLLGWGEFGGSSGWLTLILPAWLFILEELRAWRGVPGRMVVAVSGGLVALALGLGVANLTATAPPLVSGGAGAVVTAMAYALYWFHGIRWLAGREGSIR
jgi:hypothetical protein